MLEFLSPEGVYRWSEAALLNMDGEQHLMMLVSAFGHGGHDHTAADILEFHSRNGGVTWTPLDKAKVFQANIAKQNVMSPSLLRLDNGDILFFFMVKNAPLEDTGPWMRRSTDNGVSWGEPVRLPYDGYGGMAPNRAVQLSTGRILLPCWMSRDRLASTHAYSLWSDDRGKTWQKSKLITTPKGSTGRKTNPAAEEPTVIELKDGRVLMLMRTYLKSIYKSVSEDGGETWNEPDKFGDSVAGVHGDVGANAGWEPSC